MSVGERNSELPGRNSGDLMLRRDVWNASLPLGPAVQTQHLQGGGGQMYGWLADRLAVSSFIGSQQLSVVGTLGYPQFGATTNGGPYADFDGTSALYVADAAWQEAQTNNLFVYAWVNLDTVAAASTLVSKRDIGTNNISWILSFVAGVPGFQWTCNALGTVPGNVSVSDAVTTVSTGTWYFVAGFWQASTLMRLFVADADDAALNITSLAVGVPASLFDGVAPLTLGSSWNTFPTLSAPLDGKLGISRAVVNVPAATVNGFAARLFHSTRWHYQA